MATGTPAGQANGNIDGYEIAYDGKRPEAEILTVPPARLETKFTFGDPCSKNQLIFGDNLSVLRALILAGERARLVYIDPPYATGQRFGSAHAGHAYDDHVSGAVYVEDLRARLILLRELLTDDGSIYLHLDSNMLFPAKVLMDEVFGSRRFRSMITRVKCNPKNFTSKQYGDECDYILFYTMNRDSIWNQPVEPWVGQGALKEYAYVDDVSGRRYKKVPCHAPGVRNGATGGTWHGKLPPPGKHWVNAPAKLDELDEQGLIYWSANGNPRRKVFLDEAVGRRLPNFWTSFRDTQNQNARITGYPTEKNPEMLRLIVEASSNSGDLVLDAYAGGGTTLEAAAITGRRWIGIDSSITAIATALDRLRFGSRHMGSYARSNYLVRGGSDIVTTGFHGKLMVSANDTVRADTLNKVLSELHDEGSDTEAV